VGTVKILVVGGGGFIGIETARLLRSGGHAVTVAGRKPVSAEPQRSAFPYLPLDYTSSADPRPLLSGFDALVFSAGNDVRHKPPGAGDEHWHLANSVAIPRFFEAARDAGIGLAVNVGSFYTQVAPHLAQTNAYVRSRIVAETAVAALARPGFAPMSINAPLVVGHVEGVTVPFFAAHAKFALGELDSMPEFVPPGGVNFISCRSLAEAIAGGLERGEAGASYLVGDQNLSFQAYFGAYFEAVGRPPPPVRDEDSPIFPDRSIYFGRGNSLFYEPDAAETRLLGYRRNDVVPAIREIMAAQLRARGARD
jgi:nucleoside-diphosphate-sugar epimerase